MSARSLERMSILCMFCGQQAERSHLEDVFPLWLCRKLAYYAQQAHPGMQPTYENYTYSNLGDFQRDMRDGSTSGSGKLIGAKPSAYLLPNVCQLCNNGWMSRLEYALKLVVSGYLEGNSKDLAPYDQMMLALWTIKTALTYDAAREPRRIPAEHGTHLLYSRGLPLNYSEVSIGWDPDHVPQGELAHGRRLLPKPAEGAGLDVSAVQITFQLNALLLRVVVNFGNDLDTHPEVGQRMPASAPYWHSLWPPTERFEWATAEARQSRKPSRS